MTQDSQSPNLFLEVTPDSQRVERGDAVAFLVTIENRGKAAQSQNLREVDAGNLKGWIAERDPDDKDQLIFPR
jgi:hypothetical protein